MKSYIINILRKIKYLYRGCFIFIYKNKCPICGSRFGKYMEGGTTSDVWKKYKGVGAGVRMTTCPICHSGDRERLVYLFFKDRYFVENKDKHIKLLHIAPEPNLSKYLMTHKDVEYTAGDKRCEGYAYPDYVLDVDIMDMRNLADNTYDVVVCNHVLEHVPDDIVAMKELKRVLKINGFAVLQVPYAINLEKTFEDKSIVSPEKRFEVYGQSDHVRLYGKDYPERLKQAGFKVEVLGIARNYPKKFGLNPNEELFLCHKI